MRCGSVFLVCIILISNVIEYYVLPYQMLVEYCNELPPLQITAGQSRQFQFAIPRRVQQPIIVQQMVKAITGSTPSRPPNTPGGITMNTKKTPPMPYNHLVHETGSSCPSDTARTPSASSSTRTSALPTSSSAMGRRRLAAERSPQANGARFPCVRRRDAPRRDLGQGRLLAKTL